MADTHVDDLEPLRPTPPYIEAQGEHCGFSWAVKVMPLGFRCGYVAIPPGHIWWGRDYDEIQVYPHGGLTYGDQASDDAFANDGDWVIGFDCGHHLDAYDPDLASGVHKVVAGQMGEVLGGVVRSKEYVIDECRSLAGEAALARIKAWQEEDLRLRENPEKL